MSFFDIFRKKEPYVYYPNKEFVLDYNKQSTNQENSGTVHTDSRYNSRPVRERDVTPTRPNPEEKPLGRFCLDLPLSSLDRAESNNPWVFPKNHFVYRKPILPKRTVIAIAVENSIRTQAYQSEICKLISKVIEENKEALFSLIRIDTKNEYFNLIEYEDLKQQNLQKNLFSLESCSTRHVKLSNALTYICDYATLPNSKIENSINFKHRTFELDNYRIIFIGSGSTDGDAEEVQLSSEFLKLLRESNNVKAIKYFCTKDEYIISACSIGFPIIGHLESNFYE